jgi:hypothetical protein
VEKNLPLFPLRTERFPERVSQKTATYAQQPFFGKPRSNVGPALEAAFLSFHCFEGEDRLCFQGQTL